MPESNKPFSFLTGRPAQLVTLFLILQALAVYGFSRRELVPTIRPLSEFPAEFGQWRLAAEGVTEPEVAELLRADDLLNRAYTSPGGYASLFIAYFKSQRTGQAPHSPKNCLPGSGWVKEVAEIVPLEVPGAPTLHVNRYIVQKADDKNVVIYWYQSRDRVVANEFEAKFFVVADAMRYNRTDTALVRVVVPVDKGQIEAANNNASQFVRDVFPRLRQALPQ